MTARSILTCLLGAVSLCGVLQAEAWQVCLDDQVGLNPPIRASFYREFGHLLAHRDVKLVWPGCGRPEARTIQLSVRRKPPAALGNVLGLAYRGEGRIAPRLEIFFQPVAGLMENTRSSDVLGRALARVAAHEVAHFVEQTAHHDEWGLLRHSFSGPELAAEDSHPFRLLSIRR